MELNYGFMFPRDGEIKNIQVNDQLTGILPIPVKSGDFLKLVFDEDPEPRASLAQAVSIEQVLKKHGFYTLDLEIDLLRHFEEMVKSIMVEVKPLKNLTLHVKKEYFDQIKSGQKTAEYRLMNDYWKRILNQEYKDIVIMAGYPKRDDASRIIVLPWRGWTHEFIRHKHFGDKPVDVFAIKLVE